ncbi:MAG: PIN domain nuclease [Actinomycetota bacterium]|nr:PIN domain nuclease [Actinomycetota bacterium]
MPTGPIVPDTSAWVEFLRGTGSRVDRRFDELVRDPALVVVTEPVMMELLAGARNPTEWRDLRRLMARADFAPVRTPEDWHEAAVIHRRVRTGGRTLRSMLDCLIAAVAIRIGAAVLHADADFELIAEHSALEIAAP